MSRQLITYKSLLPVQTNPATSFLRFKRKRLYIPVRINSSSNKKSNHDTMSVEVLNPSKEYTDFVGSFGSMSEAQKIC